MVSANIYDSDYIYIYIIAISDYTHGIVDRSSNFAIRVPHSIQGLTRTIGIYKLLVPNRSRLFRF